jgi:hypothetical protein
MSSAYVLLMYGTGEVLLHTRGLIFEMEGYRVYRVRNYRALFSRLLTESIDILVLCHSLSQSECLQALDATSVLQPRCRTLVLTQDDSLCGQAGASAVISNYFDPRHLLSVTKKLTKGPDECANAGGSSRELPCGFGKRNG